MILCTNLKNRATTQFTSFDFDSMAKIGDAFLCAGSTGLYILAGDLPAVPAYFEPIETDFGIPNLKRVRSVSLEYYSASALTVTVSTEKGLSDTLTFPASSGKTISRDITVSRDVYGVYFTFKVSGSGAFSVESLQVPPPTVLPRER